MERARYNRPGESVNFLNEGAEALLEGDAVQLGAHGVGFVGESIPPNTVGNVWVKGVWEIDKAAEAIALGAELYYDLAAKRVTATQGGNPRVGWAATAAATGDERVLVHLG